MKSLDCYEELGLPLTLTDPGVEEITEALIAKVAEKATVPGESIHVMPIGLVTAERVVKAIQKLEQFVYECEYC